MGPTPDELRAKLEELFRAQWPRAGLRGASQTVQRGETLIESLPMERGRVLTASMIESSRPGNFSTYCFRFWNVSPDGRFSHTPNGTSVRADQLPYLAEAIAKAMDHELARLPGWASGDGTSPPARSNGEAPSTAPPAVTPETSP